MPQCLFSFRQVVFFYLLYLRIICFITLLKNKVAILFCAKSRLFFVSLNSKCLDGKNLECSTMTPFPIHWMLVKTCVLEF